jgi:cold shock CspA family protein
VQSTTTCLRYWLIPPLPEKPYSVCNLVQGRSKEVFVHISAVERAGLHNLAEGQKISFELKVDPKRGKSNADNLRV